MIKLNMKTEQEVTAARNEVARRISTTPNLTAGQKILLQGMCVALQWVAGVGGMALQDLIDGEPIGGKV